MVKLTRYLWQVVWWVVEVLWWLRLLLIMVLRAVWVQAQASHSQTHTLLLTACHSSCCSCSRASGPCCPQMRRRTLLLISHPSGIGQSEAQ